MSLVVSPDQVTKESASSSNRAGAWPPDDQALLALYQRYGSIRTLIRAVGWDCNPSTVQRRLARIPGYKPAPGIPERNRPPVVPPAQLETWFYDEKKTLAEIAKILAQRGEKISRSGISKRIKRYRSRQEKNG